MNDELGFSIDYDQSFDRLGVIGEAARVLDRSSDHLGPGATDDASEAGDIVRAFAEDRATFGRPVLHRLDTRALELLPGTQPISTHELTRTASFYYLSFPVSLFARPGRGFNRLEAKVEFNPNDNGVRPTTFDVLPTQRWATKFAVGAEASAGVTADMRLVVGAPQELAALTGLPFAGSAGAQVEAKSKLILGPFKWTLRVAEVVHTPPEHDHVFWRLDGGSFVQEQDPGLRVVLRVPREVHGLRIVSRMQATRYYNLLQSKLKQAILDLPAALRSFFSEGTPILASGDWDLSAEL